MVKIVILGSCRYAPYEILASPEEIADKHNTEEGYAEASKRFYPAIDNADVVIAYVPDGIGEHTKRDIDYAISKGKKVHIIPSPPIRFRGFLDQEGGYHES